MDTTPNRSAEASEPPRESNAYSIFMLVLTVISLGIMVLLILPLDAATLDVLRVYDNLICVVFLIDFAVRLRGIAPEAGLLHHEPGLARPYRLRSELRLLPGAAVCSVGKDQPPGAGRAHPPGQQSEQSWSMTFSGTGASTPCL